MDLGVMSMPCCMNAPSANQRLLTTLKWFDTLTNHTFTSVSTGAEKLCVKLFKVL